MSSIELVLQDGLWWSTDVMLQSWRGFQSRRGPYGAVDSESPSDGSVHLIFAPEGRETDPLSPTELASIDWVLDNEAAIADALLAALFAKYPMLQAQYGYDASEQAERMPDLRDAADLRNLLGLHSVHVHQVTRDGLPYVGFEFGCSWDEEHGLGVLMHGTRTVEIGGADTAILLWIASKDANAAENAHD